jgi:hypothetical protein
MADAKLVAGQIAASPGLRARFLKDPQRAVAEAVPGKMPFGLGVGKEREGLREELLEALTEMTAGPNEAASMRHAEAVIEQFFGDAIRNPEWSFRSILAMSGLTFLVGTALVVAGIAVGLSGDASTQNTVIAGLFGGGGVIAALGSVNTLARRGISLANCNHAQIRLVLYSFATELGHLRALDLEGLDEVSEVNGKIREAMEKAVDLLQTHVKTDPKMDKHEPAPRGVTHGDENPVPDA